MSATVSVNGSQVQSTTPILYSYLRDENGNPYGCVAALSPTAIGWSLCHGKTSTKKAETFTKERGRYIAAMRALQGSNVKPHPEKSAQLDEAIARMQERATKYFR